MMIFVDSSFFIALSDRKDQWHKPAQSLLPAIDRETFIITDLIIAESVTIIGRRCGGKSGERLYHFFTDNCRIFFSDEEILKAGMSVFLHFDGKLSVSDSVSIAVMKAKNIDRILSFDSDFDRVDGISRVC